MAKLMLIGLVVAGLVGGVYFGLNYHIQTHTVDGQAAGWKIVPRQAPGGGATDTPKPTTALRSTLRLASFHLGRFDDSKLANPRVAGVLVRLFPQFDLVAVQGVRGKNRGVLIRLVEQINAACGRTYDFITCPTQQRDGLEHYGAFIYDRGSVDVDPATVGFVEDRLGRFRVKPLIGWFRARGPAPNEAFTFWLMNVENDPAPAQTAVELDLLAEAYRAIRDKTPAEDDVILLGDLESDDKHLGRLDSLLGVAPLISGVPTTTRGTQLLDNILLDRRATSECTGRVEVVDMMRAFPEAQLTMAGALEISEHLPVWAEFSVYEDNRAIHAQ